MMFPSTAILWVTVLPVIRFAILSSSVGWRFTNALQTIQGVTTQRSPFDGPPENKVQNTVLTPPVAQDDQSTSVSSWDPDQARRRQLLLSMLAGVVGGSTIKPSPTIAQQQLILASDGTVEDLILPPLDESDYLAYTLENGLRVLLCSDPSSTAAGAAMDVHVGACSDPIQVPGLAHFHEHMLFLGTKSYPDEDSFESFLSANGGSSNAFTDSLDTVYYFEMDVDSDSKFSEGLGRFGSFFVEPLFTPSATGRELNAIDSENAKNLQTDSFRIFQLQKARANQDHPYSKFFTGNKETLLDNTLQQGINLRDELINFYKRYYSANQMTLAVVGPQSIEQLKDMVEKAFANVPNNRVDKPEEAWRGVPPFNDENSLVPAFQSIVEVVPVKDIRQVTIAWPIVYESEQNYITSLLDKPNQYVGHLLGHEGPGSLLSYLKRKGWANSVASANEEELPDFETFEVVVGLTTKGLTEVDRVIEAVFSYISLLREQVIPSYIFNEVLQLEEIQWRFLTKNGVSGYLQSLVTSMQRYPPQLYVAGTRRLGLGNFQEEPRLTGAPRSSFANKAELERTRRLVAEYVSHLSVDNAVITVMSKSFEGQTSMQEKWYGTEFRLRTVPLSTMSRWANSEPPNKLKMYFPKPNDFIPTEVGLQVLIPKAPIENARERSFEQRMQPVSPPKIIRDDDRWTVFFKQDDRFGKPQAFLIFQLMTKDVFSSPRNAALANLFELCVTDRLTEYAYDAQLAGLTYSVQVLARGVRLTFGGFNEKLMKFASYISKKLSKDVGLILPKNDNEFARYKDQIMRTLTSFDVRQPYAHASYYANLVTMPPATQYDNSVLRDETRKITLPDLLSYAKTIWSSGRGEALVQGNLVESDALRMVETLTGVLNFRSVPIDECPPRIQSLPLPRSRPENIPAILLVSEPNAANENAAVHMMIQNLSPSEKDHVLIEILASIVREPFYNELRTKRQLGYIVSSGVKGIGDSRTITFLVQSSVKSVDVITAEILSFLDTVEDNLLRKLNEGDLSVYVKSLIDRKTERDKELSIETTRNWGEISSGRRQFDRPQREAARALELEKQDLIEFWRMIYHSTDRRIIITQVVPRRGGASSNAPPLSAGYSSRRMSRDDVVEGTLVLGIDDIESFRRDLSGSYGAEEVTA